MINIKKLLNFLYGTRIQPLKMTEYYSKVLHIF
jgi:hypothetical protein